MSNCVRQFVFAEVELEYFFTSAHLFHVLSRAKHVLELVSSVRKLVRAHVRFQRFKCFRTGVFVVIVRILAILWAADGVTSKIFLTNAESISDIDTSLLAHVAICSILFFQSRFFLVEAHFKFTGEAH